MAGDEARSSDLTIAEGGVAEDPRAAEGEAGSDPAVEPSALAPADPAAWIGRVLESRYRIEAPLGAGGFGYVFRAKHLILGRDVAVKILQSSATDALARARFERESTMLAAVSHPHIVTVTDFGVTDGVPFLVMELVEGASLREIIEPGSLAPERAIRLVVQILKALAYAHERGIVHRDLKPTNVLVQSLGAEDHAKLLDFGFAKFFGAAGARANNSLTAQGTAFGTTGYIAPEQLSSATVDGRADLYAAGVILFESLVGRRPFDHGDAIEELRATLLQPPPSLESARPDLAIATMLDPILARALAKDPAERFGSATEMIEALEPFLPARSSLPSSAPVVPSPPIVPSTRITPSAGPEAPTTAFVAPAAARSTAATGGTTLLERAAALPSSVWVAAAAAMLMIALLAASVAWIGESAPEPPPAPIAEPTTGGDLEPEPVFDSALLGPPVGDRPVPEDPWATDVPEDLAAIHARLGTGEALGGEDRRTLFRQIRDRPWDPRPHLLFARAEHERRAFTSAIQSYERAYRASPASRGDERMLRDLVMMSSHATAGPRAVEALALIYGTEALPALDRAIAVLVTHPRTRARVQQARERIAAAPPPG
jgi:hypothetical protein